MALIKCKECDEEISKKAKQCPKCGAPGKKKIGFFKWLLIFFGFLFVLGLLAPEPEPQKTTINPTAARQNNVDGNNSNPNPASKSHNKVDSIVKVGNTFNTRKFEITITNVRTTTFVGSEYFHSTPPEGAIFIDIRWQFKNVSGKPLSCFSIPTIYLIAANDTKYKLDTEATTALKTALNLDSYVFSDVNPGILVRDATVFEVSKTLYDPKAWYLYVDADRNQDVVIE